MATCPDNASESKKDECKVIVIGISGATRSGKGTLSRKLLNELGGATMCTNLCQDSCFDTSVIYGELKGNWEDPRALNHDAFLGRVQEAIKKAKIPQEPESDSHSVHYVILEGFLLFHDERIVQLLDHVFWLELSKDVCHSRRMSTKRVPEDYFQRYLWPGYQTYRA